ncbi:MAG: hypothetical protein ACI92E_000420 [Oceanicoccus sp.]|jgi:hypothetical protein
MVPKAGSQYAKYHRRAETSVHQIDAFSTAFNPVDPVKVITDIDYPPYLYHEDGRLTGLTLRIVT